MIKVIAEANPRDVVKIANELGIKKQDFITLIKDEEQFLLFYWESK